MRHLRRLGALLLCAWTSLHAGQAVVTCSFSLPGEWTRVLIGESAQIYTLAGPNTDLHAYQPSPADTRKLLASDLIVGIDPSLEPWLQQIVDSNNLTDKVLWLGKGYLTHAAESDPKSGHTHSADCVHGDEDPHLWMDPSLVESMVNTLAGRCAKLSGLDPAHIEKQRSKYVAAIQTLDREIAATFAKVPTERRVIITHHGNLSRFAQRYGIRIAGVILRSSSTEAADPSARILAELIRLSRERGVVAVVRDRGQRAPAAETLAREAGLPAPLELSVDSLDAPGTPSGTWLGMMRENARRLEAAMQPR